MATCRARRKRSGPRESGSNSRNGPKVAPRCLSKTWPNAGTSEYLRLLAASCGSDKAGSADNQQERPHRKVRNPQRLDVRRSDPPKSVRRESPDCMATCRGRQKWPAPSRKAGATRSSEIPCRVDETARGGSNPVRSTGSNRWNPTGVSRAPRAIPRVRS